MSSCAESLQGVWQDASGRRWSLLDHGPQLEIYPLFDDDPAPAGLEAQPRVIDLERRGDAIAGMIHRRYLKGARVCEPATPVRVVACRGAMDLDLTDPPVPTAFDPCAYAETAPPTRARWTRIGPLRVQ